MSKANVVDKVAIDDLSEATVHGICNDPALKPGDKVQYLEKFISRAVKARMSYDTGYGSLVHHAQRELDAWHIKASEQAAKVMSTAGTQGVTLLWQIADAMKPEVSGAPYDSTNRTNDYAKLVAKTINMGHLL